MEEYIKQNINVLREDIINNWRWTEEIRREIDVINKRQNKLDEDYQKILTLLQKKLTIIDNTNV